MLTFQSENTSKRHHISLLEESVAISDNSVYSLRSFTVKKLLYIEKYKMFVNIFRKS